MNFLNDLKQEVIKSAKFNYELVQRVAQGENDRAVYNDLVQRHGLVD